MHLYPSPRFLEPHDKFQFVLWNSVLSAYPSYFVPAGEAALNLLYLDN